MSATAKLYEFLGDEHAAVKAMYARSGGSPHRPRRWRGLEPEWFVRWDQGIERLPMEAAFFTKRAARGFASRLQWRPRCHGVVVERDTGEGDTE